MTAIPKRKTPPAAKANPQPSAAAKKRRDIEIGREFGVSTRTVREWRSMGCPTEDSFDSIRNWRQLNVRERPGHSSQREPTDAELNVALDEAGADWGARRKRAEALKLEEQHREAKRLNDIAEGRLLDRIDADRWLAKAVIAVRTRLEQVPEQLRKHFPKDMQQPLVDETRKAIHLALRELAEWTFPTAEEE
ncbi:MAG TPA: hypothetical protein VGE52_04970 [Pirellulales bacterium]